MPEPPPSTRLQAKAAASSQTSPPLRHQRGSEPCAGRGAACARVRQAGTPLAARQELLGLSRRQGGDGASVGVLDDGGVKRWIRWIDLRRNGRELPLPNWNEPAATSWLEQCAMRLTLVMATTRKLARRSPGGRCSLETGMISPADLAAGWGGTSSGNLAALEFPPPSRHDRPEIRVSIPARTEAAWILSAWPEPSRRGLDRFALTMAASTSPDRRRRWPTAARGRTTGKHPHRKRATSRPMVRDIRPDRKKFSGPLVTVGGTMLCRVASFETARRPDRQPRMVAATPTECGTHNKSLSNPMKPQGQSGARSGARHACLCRTTCRRSTPPAAPSGPLRDCVRFVSKVGGDRRGRRRISPFCRHDSLDGTASKKLT